MKRFSGRAAILMLASIGALAAPVPAAAQEYDPLVQCYLNCRQAYVVNSNQPAKYQLCQNWCASQYEPNAAPADAPDVARLD